VTLLLNDELVSRVKLCLVSGFPDIVKDCPKMRNLLKIVLKKVRECGPWFMGPLCQVASKQIWPVLHLAALTLTKR